MFHDECTQFASGAEEGQVSIEKRELVLDLVIRSAASSSKNERNLRHPFGKTATAHQTIQEVFSFESNS